MWRSASRALRSAASAPRTGAPSFLSTGSAGTYTAVDRTCDAVLVETGGAGFRTEHGFNTASIAKFFPNCSHSVATQGAHHQAARSCQQYFFVNPTLQRFGYSSAASLPTTVASQTTLSQGSTQKLAADSPKEANKIPTTSYTGISKFPPYYLLFGWIEEIILDYVHHEVTRSMVLVYLRVFLLIVFKDVFLNVYDLFAP